MKIPFLKTPGIVLLAALAAAEALLLVAVPYFSGKFINSLIDGNCILLNFALLISGMIGVLICAIVKKRHAIKISRQEELRIQQKLLAELCRYNPGYVERFANGEIGMKFLRDAQIQGTFYRDLFPQVAGAVCSVTAAVVMTFWHSWQIAIIFIFFMVLLAFCLMPFKPIFARTNGTIRQIYDRSINKLFEFIHVYPFLKSMAAELPFSQLPRTRFKKFRFVNLRNDLASLRFESFHRGIILSGEVCILGVAGFFAWKKTISVGEVVFFQVLFLSVLNAFSSLFQMLPMWENIGEAKRSIEEFHQASQMEECQCGEEFCHLSGDISAENIMFHYPGSDRILFKNFSCRIAPGSIIAVTGANGCGKTTFLKLITGYLEPTSGLIRIGEKALSSFSKESFRSRISYVFQDSLLITGTVKDNITLKNPDFGEGDIKQACALAGVDGVISRLPDGINHRIGFESCGLSGGERQKIAIARALIRKPEILIFDEVTNHLDYSSRMKMRDFIRTLRGKTTVFMVSHDPELIALCDQEINLDHQEKNIFPTPQLTEWDRKCMAYHEAGHAVCSHFSAERENLLCVTIDPSSEAFGMIKTEPRLHHNETEVSFKSTIATLLAGRLAEEIFLQSKTTSCIYDLSTAQQIAADMVLKFGMGQVLGLTALQGKENIYADESCKKLICADIRNVIVEAESVARTVLKEHSAAVEKLAEKLLQENTLNKKAIEDFFKKMS